MVYSYIIFILFFAWLINAIRRVLHCVYFWQLKEYRFDRIKGDIKKSLKVLFPKTTEVSVVLLLILSLFLFSKNISLWNSLVLDVFYIFGIYSIYLLVRKKWRMPKFTKKAILLLFLSVIFILYCLFVFASNFFLFIVIIEVTVPLVTFLLAEILQIPTFFVKVRIYERAKSKIGQLKGLTAIGVTGSYGKSSTKEFLYTFLSKKYKVLRTSGNINTEIGVAQTVIDQLKPDHQIFIVEMGAYRKGEIKLLCDIVKPKFGIVTGVNEQHLALFGSLDNLLMAEGGGELANSLPKDGILFVNGDNKYCLDLYKKTSNLSDNNKKIYSLSNKEINSDIWAEDIEVGRDYVSFVAINKKGEMGHFKANVLGKQNIQNFLGAISIARELGMSFEEISDACKNISKEQAGMVLKTGKFGIDIVDSSYSANPDGVYADLDYFSIFSGKRIIVMPCLIELGEKSADIHEKIGRKIAEVCDLAIITNKDNFKEIKRGALEAGMAEKDILLYDNAKDIYSVITLFCKSGDAVLFEGRVPVGLISLLTQ